MLYMYGEELSALAWGMPDLDPPLGIDGDTMDELTMLDGAGEATAALRARVADGEDWELVERFYLALARHARDLIGWPVLVYESMLMPEEEQLARQGGRGGATTDPLAGLDVIVSLRVDEHRVAAVWRSQEEGVVMASGSVGYGEGTESVWRCTPLGADPVVLAGELPPGAVAPVLSDGTPIVSGGYWICLTPYRSLPSDPQIRFLDVEGDVFDEAIAVEGVLWLWPTQAPPGARVVQHGGGTEVLEAGAWRAEITDWGPFAPAAGEVAHELGIEEARVPVRPLAGTVLGHRHGFELAAQNGVWAAVATCGAFAVTIEGRGEPPMRLDLELFENSQGLR